MSERPQILERRLAGLDDIAQVVGALRAIASGNAARARGAVAAVHQHSDTVNAALAHMLAGTAPVRLPDGPGLTLVIGAAQGFSGAYPARIAAAAQKAAGDGAALILLGARTLSMLDKAARASILHTDELPAHLEQVPQLASRMTDLLVRAIDDHPGPVDLICGRDLPGHPVESRRIWPPAPAQSAASGAPPLTNLPPATLAAALVNEALFSTVTLALMEGYRAENQARFEAMARAQANLRDRRLAVQQDYQLARQEQMTTEMIELAATLR